MGYKYNSIYVKDNKMCMDVSFLYNNERDYVELDNLENIELENDAILIYNNDKKMFENECIDINITYELDRKNTKIILIGEFILNENKYICNEKLDLQEFVDAVAESIYSFTKLKYSSDIQHIKNFIIDKANKDLLNKYGIFSIPTQKSFVPKTVQFDKMIYFYEDGINPICISNFFEVEKISSSNKLKLRLYNCIYSYNITNTNNANIDIHIYCDNKIIVIKDYHIDSSAMNKDKLIIIFVENYNVLDYKNVSIEKPKYINCDYNNKDEYFDIVKELILPPNSNIKSNNIIIDNIFDDID